jgi:hypothetical protein
MALLAGLAAPGGPGGPGGIGGGDGSFRVLGAEVGDVGQFQSAGGIIDVEAA